MPIIDISNLPPAPTRKMSPEQFVIAADAHVASLTTMVGQLNAAFDQVEQAEANADADAKATAADRVATAADRAAARGSAELAAAYAGAAVWSPATVYPADAVVFSPSTRLLYRRKAAGSSPTDPANDGGNWASVILSVAGNPVWHSGNLNPGDYLARSGGVMTGDLATAGRLGLPNDAVAPGGHVGAARFGRFNRDAGSAVLQLGGADNARAFEVVDRDWTTVVLSASMGGFTYKGNNVWHAGIFNPANYLPLSGGTLTGSLNIPSRGTIPMRLGAGYSPTWGAENTHPTIQSDTHDRWVIFLNPHINYVQPGVNGHSANAAMTGATIRFAADTSASTFWDVGVGTNGVGADAFSIGRAGQPLLRVRNDRSTVFGGYVDIEGVVFARSDVNILNSAGNGWYTVVNRNGGNPIVSAAGITAGSIVFGASLTDTVNGAPWYGLARTSADMWSAGGAQVQLAGYYGLRLRSAGALLDIYQGSIATNVNVYSTGRFFGRDGGNGLGAITVSTAGPSGGSQGDIWIQY